MASIGDNIKRLRKNAGMSQVQLAAKLGKTDSAISQYETGNIIPRMGVIEDLASIFGVSKTEIIGDTGGVYRNSLSYQELELIDIMRTVTPEGQKQLLIYARGIASTYSKNNQVKSA